ncbi:MAG: alpha/beta fold hydrolase [Deltaproteobacteria bacterium]|nr:alpha/beta fold hydrolase [Deltaproteobacteria bacterium]
MSTYVLIHGSWHAAWCWYKITPRLEAAGHRVIVPDLPGHGRDWTLPGQVTMQAYMDLTTCILDAEPEPVVFVAHSRGGIVASRTAELRPEKIRTLVYLAAYLCPSNDTIIPLFLSDRDSLIPANLDVNVEEGWDMLRREVFRKALYADCSDEDVELANRLLMPEPSAPTNTAMETTAENFGRVPRVYIELTQDKAVSWPLQKCMYAAMPCKQVLTIEASHSAYFSKPVELTQKILIAGGDA